MVTICFIQQIARAVDVKLVTTSLSSVGYISNTSGQNWLHKLVRWPGNRNFKWKAWMSLKISYRKTAMKNADDFELIRSKYIACTVKKLRRKISCVILLEETRRRLSDSVVTDILHPVVTEKASSCNLDGTKVINVE